MHFPNVRIAAYCFRSNVAQHCAEGLTAVMRRCSAISAFSAAGMAAIDKAANSVRTCRE